MKFIVMDHNDADRENPIIDSFDTRLEAEDYALELRESHGTLTVEEWETEADAWIPQDEGEEDEGE